MKKICITGAGGFIGSHLTEMLVKKGFYVVAFDRYNTNNHYGWLENSKYKIGVVTGHRKIEVENYISENYDLAKEKIEFSEQKNNLGQPML